MKKYRIYAIIGGVLMLGLAYIGLVVPIDFAIALLVGWLVFLVRVVPRMTVDWPSVATAAVAMLAFGVGVHRVGRWWLRETHPASPAEPTHWKARWTTSGVVALVLMFAAGISMVGIAHQIGWLITSDEHLVAGEMEAAYRTGSKNQLKQIGLGAHNYNGTFGTFPAGGTFGAAGVAMHSWQKEILPFMDASYSTSILSQIQSARPWDDPENAEGFRTVVPEYLNPGVDLHRRNKRTTSPDGYALSHYAANGWVLSGKGALSVKDIPDGTSQTLFAGEVVEQFKPWGDPTNWRDPALGVNRSPEGFGGPWVGGCQFLLCDGSVRFISGSIDPSVLRAIATPAGGEKVDNY